MVIFFTSLSNPLIKTLVPSSSALKEPPWGHCSIIQVNRHQDQGNLCHWQCHMWVHHCAWHLRKVWDIVMCTWFTSFRKTNIFSIYYTSSLNPCHPKWQNLNSTINYNNFTRQQITSLVSKLHEFWLSWIKVQF